MNSGKNMLKLTYGRLQFQIFMRENFLRYQSLRLVSAGEVTDGVTLFHIKSDDLF